MDQLERYDQAINLDPDAAAIGELWHQACTSLIDSNKYYIACGEKLTAKKATLPHGAWLPWLRANAEVLGFETERTPQLLMKAAANTKLASHFDEPSAVAINRKLWGHDKTRGTQGTGDNQWYTPARYLDLARQVLGGIDLDPASTESANTTVRAAQIFTEEDDGLLQDWDGTVWLNPPYAQPAIQHFAEKMVAEIAAGRVTAAIMLTHNYTDTAWFQTLAHAAAAICFTRGRIRFEAPDGELAAPTQGQAFFYFGSEVDLFAGVFAGVGFVANVVIPSAV